MLKKNPKIIEIAVYPFEGNCIRDPGTRPTTSGRLQCHLRPDPPEGPVNLGEIYWWTPLASTIDKVEKEVPRLDILAANGAGIFAWERVATSDGWEHQLVQESFHERLCLMIEFCVDQKSITV